MKITSLIGKLVFVLLGFFLPDTICVSDCAFENVMLEPSNMYPNSFHPVVTRRSLTKEGFSSDGKELLEDLASYEVSSHRFWPFSAL